MPILFHVSIILKNTRENMTPNQSLGPTNMRPSMLDGIAAAFPKLNLIAGHMGFPWLDELFEALFYYPKIYCSVCGYINYRWLINHLDRRCGAGNESAETLCDRMMFATDRTYGREDDVRLTEQYVFFMKQFFQKVGRTYLWGGKVDIFMSGTARKIVSVTGPHFSNQGES